MTYETERPDYIAWLTDVIDELKEIEESRLSDDDSETLQESIHDLEAIRHWLRNEKQSESEPLSP